MVSVQDTSVDSLSLFSLESISTVVPPTTQNQSSNIMTVEMTNKATKYETQYPTHYINHGFEQDLSVPFNPAPEARVPNLPQSSSTTAQISSVQAGGSSTSLLAVYKKKNIVVCQC